MAELLDLSPSRALALNGLPESAAKAYFYQSGTTTPIVVYSDVGLTLPHPVPLPADASGFFPPVWANTGAIKCVVKTADLGTVLATMDPVYRVSATSSAASAITFTPTPAIAQNNVQAAIVDVQAQVAAEVTARQQGRGYTFSPSLPTTSGSANGYTGIPSWATEIIICLVSVSLSGTDHFVLQLGTASGIVSSGYTSSSASVVDTATSQAVFSNTNGFAIYGGLAASALFGEVHLTNPIDNVWTATHTFYRGNDRISVGGGQVALAAELDRFQLTRNGSNTFDSGYMVVGWR